MNERENPVKAQETDALAIAAANWLKRRHLEKIAMEYRQAAQVMAVQRRLKSCETSGQQATECDVGDMADRITRAPKKRG